MQPFLSQLRWQDAVDIVLVAVLVYQVLVFVRGTQALQVLAGLFLLFVAYMGARYLELFTLEWLLDIVVKSFLIIVIILFQAEIRRALSRMGRKALAPAGGSEPVTLEEISEGAEIMAGRRIGALIALERNITLADYLEGAVKLDALVTKDLLVSLFWPHNPTHDGAVIIQGERVAAAGCLLPLSTNPELDPDLGTRHRAAVGLTEHTDALALVVSESTGQISLARRGKLTRDLTRRQLRQALQDILETPLERKGTWFDRLARRF